MQPCQQCQNEAKQTFNLAIFFISKQKNLAYSKMLKDPSEVTSAYSRNQKDLSEANSAYSIYQKDLIERKIKVKQTLLIN